MIAALPLALLVLLVLIEIHLMIFTEVGTTVPLKGPVIVVGNGPTLSNKGLGKKIDSFPNVIRVNNFETEGFEQDVGSRTTGWHINKEFGVQRARKRILDQGLELEWMGTRRCPDLAHAFPQMELYSLRKHMGCVNFTSGTLVILHLLERGKAPVYCAGITGTSGSYYFDSTKKTRDFNERNVKKLHCDGKDQAVLRALKKQGKVIPLDNAF